MKKKLEDFRHLGSDQINHSLSGMQVRIRDKKAYFQRTKNMFVEAEISAMENEISTFMDLNQLVELLIQERAISSVEQFQDSLINMIAQNATEVIENGDHAKLDIYLDKLIRL